MYFLSYLLQLAANYTPTELCPMYSTFFGSMGSMFSMALTCVGSAYGTAKASVGISSMGVMKPELVMKGILPVIFAGIVPIYGIIICIMITSHFKVGYSLLSSFLDFGAGLTVGMSGLAAGFAIGVAGDIGVRSYAQQQKMYVPMVLILIFSEALGLYGTIVSILLITGGGSSKDLCVEA